MHRVIFKKHIYAGFSSVSSQDVFLHHIVWIPFVPPVGTEVIDGDFEAKIESLVVKDGLIFACTEDDTELYEAELRRTPKRAIADVVKDWTDCGWKVSRGYLVDEPKTPLDTP